MKNQKMPEFANNKGLDFWWHKNKAEHLADAGKPMHLNSPLEL